MRTAADKRKTNETEISISLSIDGRTGGGADGGICAGNNGGADGGICAGTGIERCKIETGCGFLNHMLTLFAFHSGFALDICARGDTDVDYHHLTEDIGIVLGQCLKKAVGDGRGIARYASVFLPMDEALVLIALDAGGRAYLNYDADIKPQKVGGFDTELVKEFLSALCRSLGLTLHVKQLYGENAHHIIEAVFKGLGRALGEALRINAAGGIPSSKGVL